MSSFYIEGGRKLSGEIVPQGAKNEALQVICATLLSSERIVLENVPEILDVLNLIELLKRMGVSVERMGANCYAFEAAELDMVYLNSADFLSSCSKLRGSVMLIGPLTARLGRSVYAKPGGDKIGRRRLDTHFVGIQKLGASLRDRKSVV